MSVLLHGQLSGRRSPTESILELSQPRCKVALGGRALLQRSLPRLRRVVVKAALAAPPDPTDEVPVADLPKRTLNVHLFLDNPDVRVSEVNLGQIRLIDESGKESDTASFGNHNFRLFKPAGNERKEGLRVDVHVNVPSGYTKTAAVLVKDVAEGKADDRFWLLNVEIGDNHYSEPAIALAESWIHAAQGWRTIFVNKAYLPSDTPSGLVEVRKEELAKLSLEDGRERQKSDRVYDYQVYNDLGTEKDHRDTLGGSKWPYPRRERTGRPEKDGREMPTQGRFKSTILDKLLPVDFYIPQDDEFSPEKAAVFQKNAIFDALPVIVNALLERFSGVLGLGDGFSSIPAVAWFFESDIWQKVNKIFPHAWDLRAPKPLVYEKRVNAWDTDQEMGRQAVAGQNPCVLQALTALPEGSAITEATVALSVEGNNVQELLEGGRRLFQVDYTALARFVPQINAQEDKEGNRLFFMYATRAVFYMSNNGLLKPIAIELIDVPHAKKPNDLVRTVYTPHDDTHLWRLAKAYFSSNDSGYHQLISHWLRTHACTEPYIIATNRQLSRLHPVYALLHPHFKYTLPINRNARQKLISAAGVIETSFSPGKYAMQFSSAIYGQGWEFDKEALPADLIRRGMAVAHPEGDIAWKGKQYSLVIDDYPYAEDGMLIWNSLRKWVSEYLQIYYTDDSKIREDPEIMGWWREIQEKGHPDKKTGWPALQTVGDLTDIITTMAWIASGHHAAVNFGQYSYSGYMLNHPSATHAPMPDPDNVEEWNNFKMDPDGKFLDVVSSRAEALTIMIVVQLLSTHDPEEEYLGQRTDGWTADHVVKDAHRRFQADVDSVQAIIEARNNNVDSKARFPDYTLLLPFTDEENNKRIKGQGVPNSISI